MPLYCFGMEIAVRIKLKPSILVRLFIVPEIKIPSRPRRLGVKILRASLNKAYSLRVPSSNLFYPETGIFIKTRLTARRAERAYVFSLSDDIMKTQLLNDTERPTVALVTRHATS